MVFVKARSWDAVGLATVGVLGVLGVRRRSDTFSAPAISPKALKVSGRCIVTGASSGIGAEVVHSLAEAGAAEVIMACRSLERCEKTRQQLFRRCMRASETETKLAELTGKDLQRSSSLRAARRRHCMEMQRKMVCKLLDLTSATSIQTFVKDTVSNPHKEQLVLVNNGGIMADEKKASDFGEPQVDLQMRTNHCGHFMLTQMLLPSMDPATSIIVVMASRAHRQGSLALDAAEELQIAVDGPDSTLTSRLLHALGLGWYARYARSKLCNVLFACELRRKYPDGPLSLAISPGLVNTGIFRSVPDPLGQVLQWLADKSFQTPAEGAQHVMNAISAAQEAQRQETQDTGETLDNLHHFPLYWHCSKPQEPSKTSMDQFLAGALWRASEVAVKNVL